MSIQRCIILCFFFRVIGTFIFPKVSLFYIIIYLGAFQMSVHTYLSGLGELLHT